MERKAEGLNKLDTEKLLELRDRIDEMLSQRRRQLETQLQRIGDDARPHGERKFRVLPKYRSKKDPSVTWSGRGMLPKWMREEIKGTNLSKEDFRIVR